ncbi:hypothetical protein SAMN05216357_11866 [Porphyromonadaceae bacterium KH3CP3RA]|nr:hypothetical protein SAMN05216357_11866 [Porphyromonadaceae bacterium KH3CP3RA]
MFSIRFEDICIYGINLNIDLANETNKDLLCFGADHSSGMF